MTSTRFALLGLAISCALSAAQSHKKVLMTDVKALTLYADKYTQARRSSAIPQISCVGGPCHDVRPDVIQCRNQGSDGYDAQWECTTDLPDGIRFGSTTVSCEGYDYPDDPYILRGSCGVEYTLKGSKKRASGGYDSGHGGGSGRSYSDRYGGSSGYSGGYSYGGGGSSSSSFWTFAMIAVVGYVVYSSCIAPNNRPVGDPYRGGGGGHGGGGGGGGGGGNNWGSGGGGGGGGGGGPSCGPGQTQQQFFNQQPRGGGWGGGGMMQGLGMGALMGYMMGGRRGYGGYGMGGGYGGYGGYRRRGMFGGGMGGMRMGGGGMRMGGGGGGMRMGGGGGGMRRAAGFGGTRRR